MANYTKREQTRAEIAAAIEAGLTPPRYPMPRCECGELATIEVNLHTRVDFYCAKHLPADALK